MLLVLVGPSGAGKSTAAARVNVVSTYGIDTSTMSEDEGVTNF